MGQPTELLRYSLWRNYLALTSSIPEHFRFLEVLLKRPPTEAWALREQRLSSILLHASRKVPYYRTLLREHEVVVDGAVKLENFTVLPLLDKDIIRKEATALYSEDLDKRQWSTNTSGGSTGEPVKLVQDKDFQDWKLAVKLLFDTWSGYRPGQPKAVLWGSERDLLVGRETLKVYLRRIITNELWLNAFRMTPTQMRDYAQRLNTFRPRQILAYVESIYELARFVEREGLDIYSPYSVMTSAGTLQPEMRETIERVFRTRIYNRYGSREVSDIACERVPGEGLVTCPATHYVELLKPDGSVAGAGEAGEVVITLLTNYAMPLIRYRIGDMAAWRQNQENAWPTFAKVLGRVTDTFWTLEGTQVHGEYFTHLFYFHDWIARFQVVQESLSKICIFIVPLDGSTDADINLRRKHQAQLQSIEDKIRLVMGGGCEVLFSFVKDIPPAPSGKYRYTISKITDPPTFRA